MKKQQKTKVYIVVILLLVIFIGIGYAYLSTTLTMGGNVKVLKAGNTVSFEEDSWETIISAVKDGNTGNYHVGDTKEVDMGSFGTHTLRIANTSTPSECSKEGFSQTACGFVLEFTDIITTYGMNYSITNIGGWPASDMYTYVQNDIYNALPSDLKSGIIDTYVVSGHGDADSANFTSTDKLYFLSPIEVNLSTEYDSAQSNTRTLDFYQGKGSEDRIKYQNGFACHWWLRAATSDNSNTFPFVTDSGMLSYIFYPDAGLGVVPAFRIG